jgi:hypothetical protein
MIPLIKKFLNVLGLPLGQLQPKMLEHNLKVGGLYSVISNEEKGTFGVVKVLVLEPSVVHICMYANTFPSRPESIDPSTLSFYGIDIENLDDETQEPTAMGFSIGHLPLSLEDFVYGWQPVWVGESLVTEDDLEGYKIWEEEAGGVFGNF